MAEVVQFCRLPILLISRLMNNKHAVLRIFFTDRFTIPQISHRVTSTRFSLQYGITHRYIRSTIQLWLYFLGHLSTIIHQSPSEPLWKFCILLLLILAGVEYNPRPPHSIFFGMLNVAGFEQERCTDNRHYPLGYTFSVRDVD